VRITSANIAVLLVPSLIVTIAGPRTTVVHGGGAMLKIPAVDASTLKVFADAPLLPM
jgi:hypothetical protein